MNRERRKELAKAIEFLNEASESLEEAKKHECTCVYSKPSLEGQTFLGLIIDGTFYDCLGNKTDAKIFHPS